MEIYIAKLNPPVQVDLPDKTSVFVNSMCTQSRSFMGGEPLYYNCQLGSITEQDGINLFLTEKTIQVSLTSTPDPGWCIDNKKIIEQIGTQLNYSIEEINLIDIIFI